MNYITPDSEIKKLFTSLESNSKITGLKVKNEAIYSMFRYHLEIIVRIAYSEVINKIEQKEKKPVSSGSSYQSNIIQRIKTRVNRKLYYSQFDNLADFQGNPKVIFVATSPQVNHKNHSIELEDLIFDCNQKKIANGFVLPEYNFTIKRNKGIHLKNYFALNEYSDNQIQFSEDDLNNLELFKQLVCSVIKFITPKDLTGLNGVVAWQLKNAAALQRILRVVKPTAVVARSLYSDKWVVMAANREQIQTIEVQHGVFTKDNFYFHSLSNLSLNELLVPTKILCLGNEWLSVLRKQDQYWTKLNSATVGTKNFFENKRQDVSKPVFLIALQDLSVELFNFYDFMVKLIADNPEIYERYEVVIRPHPIDVDSNQIRNTKLKNCRISHYNQESVASILSKANVLLTASSMMLYEAQALNVTAVSLEQYRYLTIEKNILFLEGTSNFIQKLEQFEQKKVRLEYLNMYDFNAFEQLAC
ncbi:MAG: hypothetical protein ACK5QC_02210 [Bacteroidota bacterium]|jgi:hypothetical protein